MYSLSECGGRDIFVVCGENFLQPFPLSAVAYSRQLYTIAYCFDVIFQLLTFINEINMLVLLLVSLKFGINIKVIPPSSAIWGGHFLPFNTSKEWLHRLSSV